MKTIIVATGLSLAVLGSSAPASAVSLSYNRPLTNACYEAAVIKRSPQGLPACNAAINSEATTNGGERTANLVNRGILFLLADRTTDAGRDFDEALASDPQQPEALLGKAIELWREGNNGDAIQLATRSLQYGPRRPAVAYLIRGLANEQQGQLREAYADLQMARQIEPSWAEPVQQLQRYRVVRR
jgi:tetratricopeptide (TPR) repeat protein